MDDQDLATERSGRRRGTVVWLSAAGVAVLVVGIVIGSQWDGEPSPPLADRVTTSGLANLPVVEPSSEETVATARPGTTWLADLPPVDSTSIDDTYVESPWTVASARVRKTTYTRSISATGAWCSRAQVTFAVDGKYERLTAQVAIADDSLETKELDFYVLADDQRVGDIANVGPTPQPVDIPLTGVRLLTIGVEPTSTDLSDCPGPERVGVWADPSLTALGAPPTTG